jgi:putative Mg2+ transporter-C (MgtC) family protein
MPHFLAEVPVAVANREGWLQAGELGLALLLSAIIGFEREMRQKSAGMRTHTLVGLGAGLFMLISKYGFHDVIGPGIVVDPSRVAAQIATGIGFIGAGLIFIRRDAVRGLTTAAAIWVTAAVGAAAGAGLPILAVLSTAGYLIVALVFPQITRRLPRSSTAISVVRVRYPDGRGILRQVLRVVTSNGFSVDQLATELASADGRGLNEAERAERERAERERPAALSSGQEPHDGYAPGWRLVEVALHIYGQGSVNDLASRLSDIPGVQAVIADDVNVLAEE